jgi:hypothetical protein
MIKIVTLNGTEAGQFKDPDELFNCLLTFENLKLLVKQPEFKQMHWSFTVYPPKWVAALYNHSKDPSGILKEVFEDDLPLIEICKGDYKNPQHIPVTPNVNMEYLQKKWCLDYCTFHNLILRENYEGRTTLSQVGEGGIPC